MANVRIERIPCSHTVRFVAQIQVQQGAHLIERHVQTAQLANEAQLMHIFIAIKTIAVSAYSIRANQFFFLIKADIGTAHATHLGGLSNQITVDILGALRSHRLTLE